jgi:hypothetical protein
LGDEHGLAWLIWWQVWRGKDGAELDHVICVSAGIHQDRAVWDVDINRSIEPEFRAP